MLNQQAERVGEIIASDTTRFHAQSFILHQAPSFGSLVHTSEGVYGVVSQVEHSSVEAGRRPIALGAEAADVDQIYRDHPQLAQLLRTEFEARIVAFRDGDGTCYGLPPVPPKIHSFVYRCSAQEAKSLTQQWDFLVILTEAGVDELVVACIREANALRGPDNHFLIQAGRELARLMPADPARLTSILRRIRP